MGLESPTWVNDLVITNPVSSDSRAQGDDHIRNLKSAIKNTFPAATKAFYFPGSVSKSANYNVVAADMHKTILVDTTAGSWVMTMPTLVSGDAGWECYFVKTNTGVNPYFIGPPSGTIQSGAIAALTRTRRCIPGVKTRVFWTGTAWIAERAISMPVGSVIDFWGSTLPVGYEWPNGQTLASASTNYPDYNAMKGSGITPDICGRVVAGKDDMGEASNNRMTVAGGIDGDVLGAAGGVEYHTLTVDEMPNHTHTASSVVTDPGHQHHSFNTDAVVGGPDVGAGTYPVLNRNSSNDNSYIIGGSATAAGLGLTSEVETSIGVSTTIDAAGSAAAHRIMQPTIVLNKILVVE